ncbi:protein VAPYRIN-like [Rutidosis leptorrhynchoides]|uniref:protein VAPYRIN-like n=1 Tax=Rutidosis leptorrhynchoides TaxID=125765 RepID=UPI003A990F97
MDRLISLEPLNVVAIRLEPGEKCCGQVTLRNVMYTMPVAFWLQPINKVRYRVRPQTGIISPLTTVTIEIVYDLPQNSSLPELYPHCDDSFLLRSVVAPGAAGKTSSMNDSVPSDWFTTKKKQVFVDSGIKVMFVGSMVITKLVSNGSLNEVRDVLEKSDHSWKVVDSVNAEGQSLLHLAIGQGRPDLVQVLLEFKPDVEARSSRARFRSTPLEAAVASGESLIVELLLANQANTDREDPSACGPIHLAAAGGHVDILKLLLVKGVNVVDVVTKDGDTALHLAVEQRRRDCARMLLNSGARIDIRNSRENETPLHIAAALGDENMVKLLIQKGANKNIQNRARKTPFDVAAEHGHTRLLDSLGLADTLCVAVRKGDIKTINKLLESGVTLNGLDQHGWTVLHRASFKGQADIVQSLIKKGVDIDVRDEDGYTALHCAVESGHVNVVEILLKKGVDVDARTNKGVTAMQIAESFNYTGITRVLTHESTHSKTGKYGNETGSMKKMTTRARAIRGSFDQSVAPLTVN